MNLFILNVVKNFIQEKFPSEKLTNFKNGIVFQTEELTEINKMLFIEFNLKVCRHEETFFKVSYITLENREKLQIVEEFIPDSVSNQFAIYTNGIGEEIQLNDLNDLNKIIYEIKSLLKNQNFTTEKTEIIEDWLSIFSV